VPLKGEITTFEVKQAQVHELPCFVIIKTTEGSLVNRSFFLRRCVVLKALVKDATRVKTKALVEDS
ncbi:hypothetical protein, partial [Salmonella enterica]|uniref:hypothetical protein n=1 Tax=Salmonella enterica TaxID=28901 RepID=UPI0020C1F8FA